MSMDAWTDRPSPTTARRRMSLPIAPGAMAMPSMSMEWDRASWRQRRAHRRHPLLRLTLPIRQRAGCCRLARRQGWSALEQLPNVIAAIPVAGAATIGDASVTLAITTERGGAGTARGYLVEAQVGAQTAQVQTAGDPRCAAGCRRRAGAVSSCLPPGWLMSRPGAAGRSAGARSDARRFTRTRRTLEHAAILLPD